MAAKREFAEVLSRLRERQGFSTAHEFYAKRRGREQLRMTFRNYLNVEQGKSLPRPDKLQALVSALGLGEHSDEARELAQAFLSALGLDVVARCLVAEPAAAGDSDLVDRAVRRALKPQLVHLSLEQWKAMADDYDAYVCDDLLQMTKGGLLRTQLAEQTGLPPAAVKRAVAALAAAGLAKVAGERVSSCFEGKTIEPVPSIPATVGIAAKILSHQSRLAERGRLVQNDVSKVRMTSADVAKLRRELDKLAQVAHVYEDTTPAADSAVYMVRSQLFQLFPAKKG